MDDKLHRPIWPMAWIALGPQRMSRLPHSLILACLLLPALGAQVLSPYEFLHGRRNPSSSLSGQGGERGESLVPQVGGYLPGFQGLQSIYPQYPGFPVYPATATPGAGLPGTTMPGAVPANPLGGMFPGLGGLRPTLAPRPEGGWPSWVGSQLSGEQRLAAADRAVLARLSDRVWLLAPNDNAFVPLAFYDKLRTVTAGSVVEVRARGEFQLVMHDGAQLRTWGRARLQITRLAEAGAEFGFTSVQRVWVDAKARPLAITLPDGSVLELANCSVRIEAVGGRAVVQNYGPAAARMRNRSGSFELPKAHRSTVLTQPPTASFHPADLDLEGAVRAQRQGRMLEVTGDGPGAVVWSGARFELERGRVVRLDPLAGEDFPEKKP